MRTCSVFCLLGTGFLLGGCAQVTLLEYEPFVRDIDGKNELSISTFPAGYPQETFNLPFLYKKLNTHNEVYFQVFVRDRKVKEGKNPHVESILIDSFSYQLGEGPRVELLSGFDSNFWMQGQDTKKNPPPMPFDPALSAQVQISFTLNGREYDYEGEMMPTSRTTLYPLIAEILR